MKILYVSSFDPAGVMSSHREVPRKLEEDQIVLRQFEVKP